MKKALKLVLCIVVLFIASLTFILYSENNSNYYVPEIKLQSLYSEDIISITGLVGKPYLINVFSSWCHACTENHKVLFDLSTKIDIYGVGIYDSEDNIKLFLQDQGNPYKDVSVDFVGKIAKKMHIKGVPESFLVNSKGKVIFHVQGNLIKEIIENEINKL